MSEDIHVRIEPTYLPVLRGDTHADESRVRRGGLSFGTGVAGEIAGVFDAQYIQAISHATPDTEFIVHHELDRIPQMFLVARKDRAGDVYDSGTAWTDSAIYLKVTVASVQLKLLVA